MSWCSFDIQHVAFPFCAVSFLKLRPAGFLDNLVVVLFPFGFVSEEAAKLSQKPLPVAGNIFHFQVVEDELHSPVRKEKPQVNTELLLGQI